MPHCELDIQTWMQHTHDQTCYRNDKIELLNNAYKEFKERGLIVCGKYYPGVWTIDFSRYY